MNIEHDEVHTLVASARTHGRFACDDAEEGRELSSGQPIDVLLGGHWIPGRVEFGRVSTISAMTLEDAQRPTKRYSGYYFIASQDSNVCALMVGMQIRLR